MQVSAIPAFNDNYIWAIHDQKHLIVVDPGDAAPVVEFAQANQLQLTTIFITHHHHDHVGGIQTLQQTFPDVAIYGPATENIPHCTHMVSEPDEISIRFPPCKFKVLSLPGHTLGHIAFYGESALFCGDTLFHSGCGRLFEGTPEEMMGSLNKLVQLPEKTLIYSAHEYTLSNLKFALTVEPSNTNTQQAYEKAISLRKNNQPTLPTSVAEQKNVNPFLRIDSKELKLQVDRWQQKECYNQLELFTALRRWKDQF